MHLLEKNGSLIFSRRPRGVRRCDHASPAINSCAANCSKSGGARPNSSEGIGQYLRTVPMGMVVPSLDRSGMALAQLGAARVPSEASSSIGSTEIKRQLWLVGS